MFYIIDEFEKSIAKFFNAPYAVSTDCCTHAVELSLIYTKAKTATVPTHTYLSIPMTLNKLNMDWTWKEEQWNDYYYVTDNVVDAAVLWKPNSYIPGTFMCLSFQFRKHLSLGRGGMILCDSALDRAELIKMSYDGRHRNAPWAEQDVFQMGYHYYMTPETAQLGLDKLPDAIHSEAKNWSWQDYPDLRNMSVFK